MAKKRMIHVSICESYSIDELSFFEECFFTRLIVNVDDFGRMDARPKILMARLFPLKDLAVSDVENVIKKFVKLGFIKLYEVDGKKYLYIINWDKYQELRTPQEVYPAPQHDVTDAQHDVTDAQHDVAMNLNLNLELELEKRELELEEERTNAQGAGDDSQNLQPDTPKEKPAKPPKLTENDPFWREFRQEYPKKADMKRAFDVWKKINPKQGLFNEIMNGVRTQKQSEQWTKDGGQYIPNAATWLNGERWNDELTVITAAGAGKKDGFFSAIDKWANDDTDYVSPFALNATSNNILEDNHNDEG
ncbi:hypothetical protein AGMMS49975_23250 [Clostridia bacterium]|nr:hypothetical protein AGMMS49975_23250 [Clostridia bacterium]